MVVKKIRMRPEDVNDYGDILHPETSADVVKFVDGTTVEEHKVAMATQDKLGHIKLSDIPTPTKSSVGLGNVDNVKQMPIAGGTFTGSAVAQSNTSYTTRQLRNVIMSTANPSGGLNGDIWLKYK